jgi:hypothetical protein
MRSGQPFFTSLNFFVHVTEETTSQQTNNQMRELKPRCRVEVIFCEGHPFWILKIWPIHCLLLLFYSKNKQQPIFARYLNKFFNHTIFCLIRQSNICHSRVHWYGGVHKTQIQISIKHLRDVNIILLLYLFCIIWFYDLFKSCPQQLDWSTLVIIWKITLFSNNFGYLSTINKTSNVIVDNNI